MQDHVWDPNVKYDCIWLHWFLMYLTDDDLIQALQKCVDNLSVDPLTGLSGLIVVKENVKDIGLCVDREDNSVIRSIIHFNLIFDKVGLHVLHSSKQPGWPEDLYAIQMWIL